MVKSNVSLKPYNTFGIDVKAKLLAEFTSVEELKELLKSYGNEKLLVLGGGSNVLLHNDWDGLVLVNNIKGIRVLKEDGATVEVSVGGGEVWHDWVMYTVDQGWGGIENLALIPGSVGAAPMQNIGAYGVEIKSTFKKLKALNIETLEQREFFKEECNFGYRTSIFKTTEKGKYILTDVTFELDKQPQLNLSYAPLAQAAEGINREELDVAWVANQVIKIRQSKLPDPKELGNAGSFFKNPVIAKSLFEEIKHNHPNVPSYPVSDLEVKVPAGWLIEHTGWKGKKDGEVGVHTKQALVLVNYGKGKGNDIYNLSTKIINDVASKFGITLEREVNVI